MLSLITRLSDLRLAFPSESVVEIHRAVTIATLPGAPRVIEGTVDVRGRVLPVIDLAERLGLPPRPVISADEHLVVLRAGGRTVAVRVDDAESLEELDPRALREGAPILAAARTVAGVARLGDGTVTVHDPAAFLGQAEREALDRALDDAGAR